MRTADRVLAGDWSFPLGLDSNRPFMELLQERLAMTGERRAPVIVADNVARYVHDRNPAVSLEDYPSLAPPWPSFWIEYPSSSGQQRRGVWVIDVTDESAWVEFDPPDRSKDSENILMLCAGARVDATETNGHAADEIKWVLGFVLHVESDRRVWGPAGMIAVALDENGQVIGNRWTHAALTALSTRASHVVREHEAEHPSPLGDRAIEVPTLDDVAAMSDEERAETIRWVREEHDRLAGHLPVLRERAEVARDAHTVSKFIVETVENDVGTTPDDTTVWLIRALAAAFQTVAFLHCRNVVVDDVEPDVKVQRKRAKRGKRPLLNYHTLRLDVPRAQSGSGGRGAIGDRALHIVAGHFAHYGDCCPGRHEPHGRLFGRLEGVYWMPTHARGAREAGLIETDFEVREVAG